MAFRWYPKETKFKKSQKGRIYPLTRKSSTAKVAFGYYGLKVLKNARLTVKQLEAARRMISKHMRKKEKIWIRCRPDRPLTAKPLQIRMGKGKGAVDSWIYRLQGGKVLFEIGYMRPQKAITILVSAGKKLPVPFIIVHRDTI